MCDCVTLASSVASSVASEARARVGRPCERDRGAGAGASRRNMSLPMKRSFSSEGGATAKRDWKMRLSLRSRSGHSVEALRGRRCASLRSAATPARGAEDSGRSTPSAAHRASPSPADTPAPKKSNWEVIEHFSSSKSKRSPTAVEAEGGAAQSSPALPLCPAGRPDADVQPLLTDEGQPDGGGAAGDDPGEDEPPGWWGDCVATCPPPVQELCTSNRFDNLHVEMLYQRYFLRMNQTNMTHLLGLLLAVAVGLMVVQVRTLLIAQNLLSGASFNNTIDDFNRYYDPNRYENVTTSRYHEQLAAITLAQEQRLFYEKERVAHIVNIIILGITALNVTTSRYHEQLAAITLAQEQRLFYEKERVAHIVNIIILGITALVYACLLACLSRPAMNEIYLLTISYVVLVTFLLIELALAGTSVLRSLSISTGACALFTYATYATLPVRLLEATLAGLALAAVDIGAHLVLNDANLVHIYCAVATLIACNVAGVMTHHPRELAQRRAFLETRDCVEARLVTQRENQQQVSQPPCRV
ncbi:hypothetical protein PYW07_000010 [Mythimna separata]|uniref:Adenylate cyclase N-terminal domain-containing protein n=1 Tax=Mythimna separata TaxID=271217 RepID=A0AAD7Z328_MYTSE|nr:hypothetical protein PYW07_000010 [Mythimna separata]